MFWPRLFLIILFLGSAVSAHAGIFGARYDGSYDPYSGSPPAGMSTWVYGSATILPTANSPSPGLADFTDDETTGRITVSRDNGAGTFSDTQWDDELMITARLKLGSTGVNNSWGDSTSIFNLGFYDEFNGTTRGKIIQLGFIHENPEDEDQPGLWISAGSSCDPANGAFKVTNTDYFDDQWHIFRLEKYVDVDVAKIKVTVDGVPVGDEVNYDDLKDAYWKYGNGFFTSTPVTCQATLDYMSYEVFAVDFDPLPGDANGDGYVDSTDADILSENWLFGSNGGAYATWDIGDFNRDGKVNDIDATLMAANWGATPSVGAVPEPGILTLLIGAWVAGLLLSRKKQ